MSEWRLAESIKALSLSIWKQRLLIYDWKWHSRSSFTILLKSILLRDPFLKVLISISL